MHFHMFISPVHHVMNVNVLLLNIMSLLKS